MRTIHSSGRLSEGGVCSWGVSALGGSALSALGVCLLPGGYLLPTVSAPGGGLSAPGVCGIPACTEADTPLCGQTDACKNLTFATSLRMVIT